MMVPLPTLELPRFKAPIVVSAMSFSFELNKETAPEKLLASDSVMLLAPASASPL